LVKPGIRLWAVNRSRMLKQRISTAIVLITAFLILVFWLPTRWFAFALSLPILAAAMEWSSLVGIGGGIRRGLWLLTFTLILAVVWWMRDTLIPVVILTGTGWWLAAVPRIWHSPSKHESTAFRAITGYLVLIPAWAALVVLHQANLLFLVALFLIVWLADTGAYFSGRAWGSRKLAPQVSPGKTIEGLVGGIVLAGAFAVLAAMWFDAGVYCSSVWLAVCIVASLFSVVGDLWESKMKRIAGVKDSGSLLPGHGGVLDRIDSVTAAAPVFVAGLYLASRGAETCTIMIVKF